MRNTTDAKRGVQIILLELQPLLAALFDERALRRAVIARARDANHLDPAGVVQREYALHEARCGGVALKPRGADVSHP